MVVNTFRCSSRFAFCEVCDSVESCDGNELILRVILLVLKNLIQFRTKNFYDVPLVQVLGSDVTDAFYKNFCTSFGSKSFGNPLLRCKVLPSLRVMPELTLRESLKITFTFLDLFGETYVDLMDRINSQEDRDVAV